MANEHWIGLALAAALTLLVVAAWRLRARHSVTRLPLELRRADLVFSELQFRAAGPVTLHAKVDRAYRRRDGVFVLLELKTRTRPRVYLSDVIELSAQRVALATERHVPVAEHGYVLVQGPDGRQLGCRRVKLLSDGEVLELASRRFRLLTGEIAPRANGAPHLCGGCGQRDRCTAASSARYDAVASVQRSGRR